MKRDMELVRVILLDIEEFDGQNGFMTYDDFYYDGIAETEKQRIRHHLDIMKEAGLIKMGGPDGPSGDVLRSTMERIDQLRSAIVETAQKGVEECVTVVKDAHEAYRRDIHPHLQRDFQEGYDQLRYFNDQIESFFTELGQGLKQMVRDFGAVGGALVDTTKQLAADAVMAKTAASMSGLEKTATRASSDKAVLGVTWAGYDLLDKVRDPADWERVKDASVETIMEAGKTQPKTGAHRVPVHQP